MSPSRTERRLAAREGLLAAAHRVIAEGGPHAASVARVAERAGVATGSVYRHFASRDDLVAAVLTNAAAGELVQLRLAAGPAEDPAADRIAALAAAFAARAAVSRRLLRALWLEPLPPAVMAVRTAARADLRRLVAGVLGDGPEAPVLAAALVGALVEACLADPRPPTAPEEAARILARAARRLAAQAL